MNSDKLVAESSVLAERSKKAIFHLVNTPAEIENAIERLPASSSGEAKPVSVLEHLPVGEVQYRLSSWTELSLGLGSRRGYLLGEKRGMLNYLVYAMARRDELKVAMADMQHIGGHHGIGELKQDCANSNWHFPKTIRRPRVAHFYGRKPSLFDWQAYSRPFTIARLEHYRRHHATWEPGWSC